MYDITAAPNAALWKQRPGKSAERESAHQESAGREPVYKKRMDREPVYQKYAEKQPTNQEPGQEIHHRSTRLEEKNHHIPVSSQYPFQHEAVLPYRIFSGFLLYFGCCRTVNNSPIMLKSSLLNSASSQLS